MKITQSEGRVQLDWSDASPPLTASQRQALDLDRAIAVAAGAGSGKTHVLAMRYAGALLAVASVEALRGKIRSPLPHVLVLTFTEKAADEMRERCQLRLSELIQAVRDSDLRSDVSERLVASLARAADGFAAARISTFHGLCARILRELPVSSGASPRFTVLDAAAAQERRLAAATVAVDAVAAEPGPALGALLRALNSRGRIIEAVAQLVADRHRLAGPIAAHGAGLVSVDDLVAASPVSPDEARDWLVRRGGPTLVRLAALLTAAPEDEGLLPAVRAMLDRIAAAGDVDPITLFGTYRDSVRVLLTADHGKVRKLTHFTAMGRKGRWADPATYLDARRTLEILEAEAPAWAAEAERARATPTDADARMLTVLHPLCAMATRAIAAYRAELDDDAVLDFTELEVRASAALDSPGAIALRGRFQHILVDELQDTDSAQWALVQRLLARPDGLFAVGDKKQAIYRFRGGDVTVFDTAVRAVGGAVDLADNFRTRRALIDWMNALFAQVLGPASPDRPPWEAHHEPLRAWRADTGGSVAILTSPAGESAAQERDADARSLADWIADRVLGGDGPYAGSEFADRTRWPTPPIAILLRTRARLSLYLAALRARGVPATVARGVGFWQRREITDLVVLLRAITANDPVATVGWLRSPLGGVPDATLDAVAQDRKPDLFETLDDPRLEPARSRWLALRAMAKARPPTEVLVGAMLACEAEHAWATDGIDDAPANVARLVERVGALAASGQDLPAIASHLWRQVLDEETESEAVVVPGRARVVLLTVHAAKGLEFPVVVVPELDARTEGRPGPIAARHRPGPVSVSLACSAPGMGRYRAPERPGTWVRLETERAAEEAAEHRRLLYVALTRARDHLVLSGRLRPRSNETRRPSWMDHLVDLHPVIATLTDPAGVVLAEGVAAFPTPEPTIVAPAPASSVPVARVRPAVAMPPPEEIDAAIADDAAICPARGVLAHRLGVREEPEITVLRHQWGDGLDDHPDPEVQKRLARFGRGTRRRRLDRVTLRAILGETRLITTIDRLEEGRDGWALLGLGVGPARLALDAAISASALGIRVTSAASVAADGSVAEVVLEAPVVPTLRPWPEALAAASALPRPCPTCPFHRRPCPGVP